MSESRLDGLVGLEFRHSDFTVRVTSINKSTWWINTQERCGNWAWNGSYSVFQFFEVFGQSIKDHRLQDRTPVIQCL